MLQGGEKHVLHSVVKLESTDGMILKRMLNRQCGVQLPRISGGDEDVVLSTILGYASPVVM